VSYTAVFHYGTHVTYCLVLCFAVLPPLTPVDHIWYVVLVWREGNVNRAVSVLQYCVPLQRKRHFAVLFNG